MQAPVKLRRTSGFSARHKKKGKTKPKPRPKESFPGITEETATFETHVDPIINYSKVNVVAATATSNM